MEKTKARHSYGVAYFLLICKEKCFIYKNFSINFATYSITIAFALFILV